MFENILHIGDTAPNFNCTSTFGAFCLNDYKGKWIIFFSHPGDFTPVCTSEFLAFASCYNKFKEINAELIALSVDSNPSHLAWIKNIYDNSNILIPFPVISDMNSQIANLYNMKKSTDTSCIRNVYIIDPTLKIRTILIYPKEIGRNVYEILRIVKALQLSDEKNVLTPANWNSNLPSLVKAPATYDDLLKRINNKNYFSYFDWYLCFNKNGGELDG